MSIDALMVHRAYVLEFRLAPATDMDARRVYCRRTDPATGRKEVVRCRVSQLGSQDLLLHAMRAAEITHRVYFSANPNLSLEHRLEIGGVQYMLLGLPTEPSLAGRMWNVDVKAITLQNELVEVLE